MSKISIFLSNKVVIITLTSFIAAQLLKVIFNFIFNRRMDFARLMGSGGMPSSHSALVVSLATSIGRIEGIDSNAFAISLVVAGVVMYDAAGVRRAAGQQAKILNRIMANWENNDPEFVATNLKELLGHTPLEVLCGAILGFLIAMFV